MISGTARSKSRAATGAAAAAGGSPEEENMVAWGQYNHDGPETEVLGV